MAPRNNSRRPLVSRIYQDLTELQNEPYNGFTVFTNEADFRKLCLILMPSTGPFRDIALHFDVRLVEEWPSTPPRISSSVIGIDHPNLLNGQMCTDLLNNIYYTFPEYLGYTGGYTPALTLRGLFLQFLTFFSSTTFEYGVGNIKKLGDATYLRYALPEKDTKYHLPGKTSCTETCACADTETQHSLATMWYDCKAQDEIVYAKPDGQSHKRKFLPNGQVLHQVEWVNPRRSSTLEQVKKWKCRTCPYGSPALPHIRTEHIMTSGLVADGEEVVPLPGPPLVCKLPMLNDDVLMELPMHLGTETLNSLSLAYPRFAALVSDYHILLQRELRCFFLRLPLRQTILGVGVSFTVKGRFLSSEFDWLSMQAFEDFNVRKSILKRPFSYFLPLAFSRIHFERVEKEVWKRLAILDSALWNAELTSTHKTRRPTNRRIGPPLKPHHTIEALYRMMNNIVVSLVKTCDPKTSKDAQVDYDVQRPMTIIYASEKAITSYCHLFHLLIKLCEKTPEILEDAVSKLDLFLENAESRDKVHTSDMGEFIIIVMLVLILHRGTGDQPPVTWRDMASKILEEVLTRNVFWILKDVPELEVLESGPSDYRLGKTFECSKTSLRTVMLQITFLDQFTKMYASDLSRLDDHYGFPEKELPERMVSKIKCIYEVDSWTRFFEVIRYTDGATLTKEAISQMLRNSVQKSVARKYHVPPARCKFEELKAKRTDIQQEVLGTQ